jgi:hypothetical protein
MGEHGKYDAAHLHAIMAGSGRPYAVITPQRKRMLRALHDGLSVESLAHAFELPVDAVRAELDPLVDASLVRMEGGTYKPAFFIADARETQAISEDARKMGEALGGYLLERRQDLANLYDRLAIHNRYYYRVLAFLLVGDLVLDVGLLDALNRDGTLLPEPPPRPSPEDPEARYYFWMIEGDQDRLGRYGQRRTDLPWPGWTHISFGQYWIDGLRNVHRDEQDKEVLGLAVDGRATSPGQLAELAGIPLIDEADHRLWSDGTRAIADGLAGVYRAAERSLRVLYETLKARSDTPWGFGEFFCWYDHVAYAGAIDRLAEVGMIAIPNHRHAAAICCDLGGGSF